MYKPHPSTFVAVEVRHEAGSGLWRATAREHDADTGHEIGAALVAYGSGPSAAALEARRLILARTGR